MLTGGPSKKRARPNPPAQTDVPPTTTEAQKEWLLRSSTWKDLSPRAQVGSWKPRRFLGSGSFGMVGLWERIDDVESAESISVDPRIPRRIAVKQSGPDFLSRQSMQMESYLMQQCNISGSDHILKIYKGYHLDFGTATDGARDPTPFDADDKYDADQQVCSKFDLVRDHLNENESSADFGALLMCQRNLSRILRGRRFGCRLGQTWEDQRSFSA